MLAVYSLGIYPREPYFPGTAITIGALVKSSKNEFGDHEFGDDKFGDDEFGDDESLPHGRPTTTTQKSYGKHHRAY